MITVEVETNTTLVNSLKNRNDTNIQRGYITLLNRIRATYINPEFHILDNACSDIMENLIQQHCAHELVPPHFHQRNVAEVTIKVFKQHFLSILACMAKYLTMQQWERLLPQA